MPKKPVNVPPTKLPRYKAPISRLSILESFIAAIDASITSCEIDLSCSLPKLVLPTPDTDTCLINLYL